MKTKLPQVMVVMVTKDKVLPRCLSAVLNQDYGNFSALIHYMKPRKTHENKFAELTLNVSENKEMARKMALTSEAEFFLFVDSDVVLPQNAITELVRQLTAPPPDEKMKKMVKEMTGKKALYIKKYAMAGYYPFKVPKAEKWTMLGLLRRLKILPPDAWIIGRLVADNTILHLRKVEPSVVRVDFAGAGCLMIKRELLKKLKFRPGIDTFVQEATTKNVIFLDDSLDLCFQMIELGYQLWADGSVVCKHL